MILWNGGVCGGGWDSRFLASLGMTMSMGGGGAVGMILWSGGVCGGGWDSRFLALLGMTMSVSGGGGWNIEHRS
jgi:hypothetical protein